MVARRGRSDRVAILWLLPEQHATSGDVFAQTINDSGMFGGKCRRPGPVAFFAVVSIGVAACTCASRYPSTSAGGWATTSRWASGNLRGHHKWMAPVAVLEITITSIIAMFPTSSGGLF